MTALTSGGPIYALARELFPILQQLIAEGAET